MSTQMTAYADSPPLQQWATANRPRKGLLWEPGYSEQIMFVADRLAPLFLTYEELKLTPRAGGGLAYIQVRRPARVRDCGPREA
ncbi:MAG TPA: hypothetical protein VK694_02890 [Verrucomicrobiae bacterium]|nr:hypothetical protein [Verrucomicrobiae bacterium]